MMFCPKCKQFFRKVVFGIACGCTVLSGHAEEPPHTKFHFQQVGAQEVVAVSTSASTAIAPLSGWMIGSPPGDGSTGSS
jgi:hypothetical protein